MFLSHTPSLIIYCQFQVHDNKMEPVLLSQNVFGRLFIFVVVIYRAFEHSNQCAVTVSGKA